MFAEERFLQFLHLLATRRKRSSGLHDRVVDHEHHHAHQLYQVSTLNAIMDGAYDGTLSILDLCEHGDFGIGTFNGLDGEMIVVDGEVYQATVDGAVRLVEAPLRTPFAVVQFFEPEWQGQVDSPFAFNDLPQVLQEHLASSNYFYALRIDGEFAAVRARSIARQHAPYRPLAEVAKEQQIFNFVSVVGTMVGFRFPDYTHGLNMPGWHLHFISADRQYGGHVLDFTLAHGQVAVEHTTDFYMELPQNAGFANADLSQDQRAAITRIER